MNDTPRTNRFYASFADGECIPNQDEWLALCESLETELTEAQEKIEMLNIRYGAAAMHHDNNMGEVMDQRDRLAEALGRFEGCYDCYECFGIAEQALQSLTTNELCTEQN